MELLRHDIDRKFSRSKRMMARLCAAAIAATTLGACVVPAVAYADDPATGVTAGSSTQTGAIEGSGSAEGGATGDTGTGDGDAGDAGNAGNGNDTGSADDGSSDGGAAGDGATGDNGSGNNGANGDGTGGDDSTGSDDKEDANGDNATTDTTPEVIKSHRLTTGVSPEGTGINLFDYWTSGEQSSSDSRGTNEGKEGRKQLEEGINKDHPLKFSKALNWTSYGVKCGKDCGYKPNAYEDGIDATDPKNDFNLSTGTETPRSGMVESMTTIDGYPKLKENAAIGINEEQASNGSLQYLFDPNEQVDGKASYRGVSNLLQVDDNGYYYFDSKKNFAEYDETKNVFNLYDSCGVYPQQGTSACNSGKVGQGNQWNNFTGQFFPFNAASEVFDVEKTTSEKLALNSNFRSVSETANHYLGMTLTTRFVQNKNGCAVTGTNGTCTTNTTFHFEGDDDVWLYIDDVLVGDLGGSHNATTLDIDFAEGKVKVNGVDQKSMRMGSALYQKFVEARGKEAADSMFDDTHTRLLDDSYHTLKMFYLERGNYDSDLALSFNLAPVPTSDIIKVDQSGGNLDGAVFDLYNTDEKYSVGEDADPMATGTTAGGSLLLQAAQNIFKGEELLVAQGNVLNFGDLYSKDPSSYGHYVLRERSAPAGYRRMTGDLKLQYYAFDKSTSSGTGVLITDPSTDDANSSAWSSGAISRGKVQLTAPTSLSYGTGGSDDTTLTAEDAVNKGTVFVVVLRGLGEGTNKQWYAVTGNQIDGWKYASQQSTNDNLEGIVEAHKAQPHDFALDPSTRTYQASINELPGPITKYHYAMGSDANTNAKYTVAYYYSTEKGDKITAQNTHRLSNDTYQKFDRVFSTRIYVPNTMNQLFVQKVDEKGEPILTGAEFSLYKAENVIMPLDVDGVPQVADGAEPYDKVTTNAKQWLDDNDPETPEELKDNNPQTPSVAGAAMFPSDVQNKPLVNGVYWLKETQAPTGYVASDKLTKVIVNDNGIFVDAGTAGDGIQVVRGVGRLVKTMAAFGATGAMNDTLRYVKVSPNLVTMNGNDPSTSQAAPNGAQPCSADADGIITCDSRTTSSLPLTYGSTGSLLEYGPRDGHNMMYRFDEGWPMITTTQDSRPGDVTTTNVDRTDLTQTTCPVWKPNCEDSEKQQQTLSALITGSVGVQVSNPIAPASVTIEARKTLADNMDSGKELAAGEFSFQLYKADKGGNVIGSPLQSVTNGKPGKDGPASAEVWFDSLEYTEPGTYYYVIKEQIGSSDGIKYDTHEYRVTVNVSKGADGALKAEVTYPKADTQAGAGANADAQESTQPDADAGASGSEDSAPQEPPTFVNIRQTPPPDQTNATGELTISKTLAGSNASKYSDKEFTFEVTLSGEKVNGSYSITTPDGTNGTLTFKEGRATVKLKGGQSLTVTGLPVGTKWSVIEKLSDGDKEIFSSTIKDSDASNGGTGDGLGVIGTENEQDNVAVTNTVGEPPVTPPVTPPSDDKNPPDECDPDAEDCDPDTPPTPENPDEPNKPDQPGTPETPSTPNTPVNPNTPGQPDKPTQPKPDKPKPTLSTTGAAIGGVLVVALATGAAGLALALTHRRRAAHARR